MTLSDWIVAIPSYKRHDQIMEKSLSTLKHYKVPPSRITIFVADKEEKKLYEEAIPKGTVKDIVVGVLGMDKIRNFILDYYPKGKHIVMMDDDIRGFNQKAGTNTVKPLGSLISLIERGFRVANAENCCLWGIYPVNSGLYMNRPTVYNRLLLGYHQPHGTQRPERDSNTYAWKGRLHENYISVRTRR